MSKRPVMSRGGTKIAPRAPAPASPAPAAASSVGASGFTDGGVAQHALNGPTDAGNTRTGTAVPASPSEKYYDKFDGSRALEALYGKFMDDDTPQVEYAGERYAPNASNDAIFKKLAAISAK